MGQRTVINLHVHIFSPQLDFFFSEVEFFLIFFYNQKKDSNN